MPVVDDLRKAHTVSRKIERLINLTIALLATKRFLTKSEIFRTVDGYEGSPDTRERMFERDKDDLRTLGIEIEVGSYDPLFNDEAGYKIKNENYELDLGEITSIELSLLSLAAQSWQGAALDGAAQKAILKLNSMGIRADSLELPGFLPKLGNSDLDIAIIISAIAEKNFLNFSYLSADLKTQMRSVIPFALASYRGFWYLACIDQDVQEVRIFRLDRIIGTVLAKENMKEFDPPSNFDFAATLLVERGSRFAVVDVRKQKANSLRALAVTSKDLGEWDELSIPIVNLESLSTQILWHGEDAFVQSPNDLKELVMKGLEALVRNHG